LFEERPGGLEGIGKKLFAIQAQQPLFANDEQQMTND
jgi:hypothetical protein